MIKGSIVQTGAHSQTLLTHEKATKLFKPLIILHLLHIPLRLDTINDTKHPLLGFCDHHFYRRFKSM